ncbi:MAG TPA: universal stress protein [Steroidobacteraceae bacterium]|nr:universal stress protein [Steroidobacteraceae bacterium]
MPSTRKNLTVRRILVAIRDTQQPLRQQLSKAAVLARSLGASVELFHAITEPIAPRLMHRRDGFENVFASAREMVEKRLQRRLDKLAHSPELRGLRVHSVLSWDYPPHEAVVRHVLATRADLVIAGTRERSFGTRLLLTNTDWELVRQCPCLLLLVKSSRDYRKPAVIASIDPFHAHAKPARLDDRIVDVGAAIAKRLGGQLHVFHAYLPLTILAPGPAGQPLALAPSPELEDVHTESVSTVFGKFAEKAGVPPARRHLHMGDVTSELESVVKKTNAGIVVMGAVSRSRLRRIFIGNTAESVLDRLSCDLLVVKPGRFVTEVPKRPRAALTARAGK